VPEEHPDIRAAREQIGRALTAFPWRVGGNANKAADAARGILQILDRDLREQDQPQPVANLNSMLDEFYVPADDS